MVKNEIIGNKNVQLFKATPKNPGVAKKQWLHFWGDHNGYDRLHKFFLQWVGPIGDMAAEFDKVDRFSS